MFLKKTLKIFLKEIIEKNLELTGKIQWVKNHDKFRIVSLFNEKNWQKLQKLLICNFKIYLYILCKNIFIYFM